MHRVCASGSDGAGNVTDIASVEPAKLELACELAGAAADFEHRRGALGQCELVAFDEGPQVQSSNVVDWLTHRGSRSRMR
jgi:hypothetical protein